MHLIQKYFTDIEECVRDFNINLENLQVTPSDVLLYTSALMVYKKLFLDLLRCTSDEEIEHSTKALVHFAIENEISYLFLYSELVTVVRKLLGRLVEKQDLEHLNEINIFFEMHEQRITILYLQIFLNNLKLKNELRLSHISLMNHKNFMIHYENHIQWIINLIKYIQKNEFDNKHPELNHNLCEFGKWMHNATTSYMLSTSHFKLIEKLHINLHDLAANVVSHCKSKEFRPSTIIHLMQMIEYYSIEIGNEIAFLNEIEESAKDPLTHLLTRRLFNKIMLNKIDISKATGREFSLMMCDLDHFKVINDTYGHAVGDIVLKHFANILEQTLRKSDYIFRFGGEEFMILLPTTNKEEALILAQKVCDVTASTNVEVDDLSINYTVSIGTVMVLLDNSVATVQDTIDKYIVEVDEKLYLAKEHGRNCVT